MGEDGQAGDGRPDMVNRDPNNLNDSLMVRRITLCIKLVVGEHKIISHKHPFCLFKHVLSKTLLLYYNGGSKINCYSSNS